MFSQEIANTCDEFAQVTKEAFHHGAAVVGSPSVATRGPGREPGKSAGVAILSPGPRGLLAFDGGPGLGSPPFPGRVPAAFWPGILGRGILVISVYLFDSEGLSGRNEALLAYIVSLVKVAKCPFVIGGDFNLHPSTLASHCCVEQMGAIVMAPFDDTYVSGGFSSKIDLFIIHTGLSSLVTCCSVDDGAPIAKHSVVRLSLRADNKQGLSRQMVRPVMYPKAAPVCCRFSPRPKTALVRQANALVEEGPHLMGTSQQAGLDELYQSWAGEAETHLDSLYGLSRSQPSSRVHGFIT